MSEKPPPKPTWWKNTYFWIGGILFLIAGYGLIRGESAIRDPGQKHENGLVLIYLAASAVMLLNGWLSHKQTVQHYQEYLEGESN